MYTKSLHLCSTLCEPMDCSLPGSSVLGILQAGIPEWVTMLFSRGSSWPRDPTLVSYVSCIGRWVLYHLHHLGTCSQVERVEISRGKQAMSVSIVAFFNMCWAPSYREGTPQRNKWDLNILPGVTRTVWSHSNITATFSLFARQV